MVRAGQPVKGRERIAVWVPREVPDDQRMACGAAKQDGEWNRGLSAELGRDGRAIGGAGYLRFFSVARRKSTSRSSDWRMKRFSFCSNSGSAPR